MAIIHASVQILSMGFHRCIFDYFQSGDDNSKKKVKAYDNASRFMNGYAAVEINGKMYLVNEKFDICSEEFDGDISYS